MPPQSGVAFQDFSFQPSRSTAAPYYPVDNASYSPRDPPVSSQDLGLLAQQFGQQSLRHDPRNVANTYYQPAAPGPYHHTVPQSHATASLHHTSQSHQPSSHSQIQPTSPIQCQAGHVLQMPSLIQHMAATGQCYYCSASTANAEASSAWDDETRNDEFEDEGFEEPPSLARLTYRRSTDLSASGHGYVAKPIRLRKKSRNDPSRLR